MWKRNCIVFMCPLRGDYPPFVSHLLFQIDTHFSVGSHVYPSTVNHCSSKVRDVRAGPCRCLPFPRCDCTSPFPQAPPCPFLFGHSNNYTSGSYITHPLLDRQQFLHDKQSSFFCERLSWRRLQGVSPSSARSATLS
jgi:hypothetical protein